MTRQQRLVLIISILASFVAFLDGSVVNVALPAISRDLGGGLITQQWVVDAYLISLGALILLAGSLSDLLGRKRILEIGVFGFAASSLFCAAAPNNTLLIAARGLQGIAGALLVPSSLALIIATFSGRAQGKAIGSWTAWTGISFILGPLLGGFLVDTVSWRLIFAINIIPVAICLWLLRALEEDRNPSHVPLDVTGALLCVVGLLLTVFSLIEEPRYGWLSPLICAPLACGLLILGAFIMFESRTKSPMLPLSLFRVRNFWGGNLATIAIYGALSVATFMIVIFLQQSAGYSALAAGLSLLPVTLIMFALSPRVGSLAGRFGPRLFMTVGPLTAGAGFLLLSRVSEQSPYSTQVLPAMLVFGIGLTMTVAPLTSAVLGDIAKQQAGVASAINNATSRLAGLICIAVVGVFVGTNLSLNGFHRVMIMTAGLTALGGVVSYLTIRNHHTAER